MKDFERLHDLASKLDEIHPGWEDKFLSTDAAVRFYRTELGDMGVEFPKPGRTIHSSPFEPPTIVDDREDFEGDEHE
jgi:hypothetical protein